MMSVKLISNPPYNIKWECPPFAQLQPRFYECEVPPESNANYAFVLTALNVADKAVFLLPCGFLSTDNEKEKKIRKNLVERNYIETIITCPDRMFEATGIAVCIVVFNKEKQNTKINMIDARGTYEVEERLQNGQYGGAAHENRTYKKQVKVFSAEIINKIIKAIENEENTKEFSKTVSIQDVVADGYNLTPSRYIDFLEQENTHREYKDILCDLNMTITEKNVLKLTVNESVAKSLGLYEFALIQKEARENAKLMSENMEKLFGVPIEKDDYISVTKNKNEIKFENKSKEKISEIFLMVLQMYKSHIMFLNNEENRYLVELRDAILPELMDGTIKLE